MVRLIYKLFFHLTLMVMQLHLVIKSLKRMEKYGMDKTQRPLTSDSLKKYIDAKHADEGSKLSTTFIWYGSPQFLHTTMS